MLEKRLDNIDSKLQNLQYDLSALEEDLKYAHISGKKAAELLLKFNGKIEDVRVLVSNLKKFGASNA